jgi:hypothetical protein
MPVLDLARLERLKAVYGNDAASAKLRLLRRLARAPLRTAGQVERLHEVLCFLRAYPDDARVLSQATRMLEGFDRRADLARHRDALADSGIAGTAIRYRFFWSTALWMARRWPDCLHFERDDEDAAAQLDKALPLVAPAVASEWFNAGTMHAHDAIDRLRGKRTDAAWFVEQLAHMPGDGLTREAFADAIDASFVLAPGPGTPSRSRAHFAPAPRAFQLGPHRRTRPDLRAAMAIAPRGVRLLSRRDGAALIELARCSMVTRARDLMAFEYADASAVRLVDDGDGLAFAFCGVIPERRFLLPALYGCLTLRNGVPIGYVQVEALGPYAAVSYNTFDTFRGGEAGYVFARLLSAIRHLFGAESFSIEPYQLGFDNEEGIDSGAWWFYYKLGFRPRAAAARQRVRQELARMRLNPFHRSSARTLRALAEHHLFFDFDPASPRGLPPVQAVLDRAVDWLARRGGGTEAVAAAEAAALAVTGLESLAGFDRDERLAWRRWAPIVASLPGAARWNGPQRRALAAIVRAKGGRHELDFLVRFAAHPKLAEALFGGKS